MFPRCVFCKKILWPWQHWGVRVVARGRSIVWHTKCAGKYHGL